MDLERILPRQAQAENLSREVGFGVWGRGGKSLDELGWRGRKLDMNIGWMWGNERSERDVCIELELTRTGSTPEGDIGTPLSSVVIARPRGAAVISASCFQATRR